MTLLESDPHVKKVMADLSQRQRLPMDAMTRKAIHLLKLLNDRKSNPGNNARGVPESRSLVSANRTRLVYIKLQLTMERNKLSGIRADLRDYLHVKYVNYLQGSGVKNQKTRTALVARALAPLSVYIRELEDVLEVVETVLGDYESRSFSFRDIIKSFELREREA